MLCQVGSLAEIMGGSYHRVYLRLNGTGYFFFQIGFSGIDSSTPEYDATPFLLAIIVSQAVDNRIVSLR